MTKYINSAEVHAIDEDVVVYYLDEKDEKIAMFSMSVEEATAYIELLQEAVEEAKKSRYYQPKGE